MKRWIAILGLLPLLLSCASFPEPEAPESSLVIGYLVLDYPDGWFDQAKRTIASGVTLYFTNQSSGNKFWLTTSQGYFQFLSNGTDSYSLESYKVTVDRSTSSGDISLKFTAKPHTVVYLGHHTMIHTDPQKTTKTTPEGRGTYWTYKRSTNSQEKEGEMLTYLKSKDPESPWLEYEVVH